MENTSRRSGWYDTHAHTRGWHDTHAHTRTLTHTHTHVVGMTHTHTHAHAHSHSRTGGWHDTHAHTRTHSHSHTQVDGVWEAPHGPAFDSKDHKFRIFARWPFRFAHGCVCVLTCSSETGRALLLKQRQTPSPFSIVLSDELLAEEKAVSPVKRSRKSVLEALHQKEIPTPKHTSPQLTSPQPTSPQLPAPPDPKELETRIYTELSSWRQHNVHEHPNDCESLPPLSSLRLLSQLRFVCCFGSILS
jgi:hypothetical protein